MTDQNLELQQAYDFCDESNAVYKLLSSLSDSDYEEKTQFKGWNFNNVIGHLHVWNYAADLSLQDGDDWKNFANSALEMLGKGSTMNQFEETITKGIKGRELLDIWKSNSRLCPHFHLPLQSGSNQILKKMRRRYSSEEFIQITSLIKKYLPQASITTDVIVGFPSEKEEDFENTLYTINKSNLNNLHVFPYSVRPKTTAFYLKDHNSPEVIKSRSKELNRISKLITTKSMRNIIGKKRSILWEGKNMNSGLTEDYYRVIRKSVKLPNEYISKQKIKGLEKDKLYI